MTEEALRQFGEGKAFIDMQGTTAHDWIDLIEQCKKVGVDLNERAKSHLNDYAILDLGCNPPFVYFLKLHKSGYKYLKCSGADKLTTWNSNILGLPIYKYTPSEMPVFKI